MMKVNERTGAHAFGFLTRGSIDDSGTPSWFGSASGVDFLKEVLHLNPWDMLALFEQWSCAKDKSQFLQIQMFFHGANDRISAQAAKLSVRDALGLCQDDPQQPQYVLTYRVHLFVPR